MSSTNIAEVTVDKPHWLDRRLFSIEQLTLENLLYLGLIGVAIFTRFWMLGDRTMSHDESLHVFFSWNLYKGSGFSHTPLMHGPFKFDLLALVYSLFGADDFTARLSVAVFGVVLVMLPFFFRRWLGRKGALIMSFMLLISPSIWYHARYIRDEAFMLVWGVLIALAMFKYLQTHSTKWLFFMAAIVALMYATMEAAFIFVAIYGLFMVIVVLADLISQSKDRQLIIARTVAVTLGAAVSAIALLILQASPVLIMIVAVLYLVSLAFIWRDVALRLVLGIGGAAVIAIGLLMVHALLLGAL